MTTEATPLVVEKYAAIVLLSHNIIESSLA